MPNVKRTINRNPKVEKFIEMTGSPRDTGFKTKADFLKALSKYGFKQDTMKVKNNKVCMLVTNTPDSNTLKMQKARRLGIEIFTYEDLITIYGL